VGYQAAYTNQTGVGITAFGANALYATTASDNCGIGTDNPGNYAAALESNSTGRFNTAVATGALGSNTTGQYNSALGHSALASNTTADRNTAVGYNSLFDTTTGTKNTALGYEAGDDVTTGQQNVLLGHQSAYNLSSGNFNVCVGSLARVTGANNEFVIALGYNIEGASNYTTIGKSGSDIRALHGSTTWSTVSDERYKKDIVSSTAGLSFINDLQPRTFKYKNLGEIPNTFNAYQEGSTEVFKNANTNHGFIAQEVKAVIDAHSEIKDGFTLWDERDDGSQEVAESALIPILTKAIQELSAKNDALEARIATLEGV